MFPNVSQWQTIDAKPWAGAGTGLHAASGPGRFSSGGAVPEPPL